MKKKWQNIVVCGRIGRTMPELHATHTKNDNVIVKIIVKLAAADKTHHLQAVHRLAVGLFLRNKTNVIC